MFYKKFVFSVLISILLGICSVHAMNLDENPDRKAAVPPKILSEKDIKGVPFYTFFEGSDRKKALGILSKKYQTLKVWFGCQRKREEWIPFDGSLKTRAMDLMVGYDGLQSGPNWIEYKSKIELTRKEFKELKAKFKAMRPSLPWPGNVYSPSLRLSLLQCKAAKYDLLGQLPNLTADFKMICLDKAVIFSLSANEEEKNVVFKPSPEFPRKTCTLPRSEPINFQDVQSPAVPPRDDLKELETKNPLCNSGEYDPPSALTEGPTVRKRVPRARITNIPLHAVSKFVNSTTPLTERQKADIQMLITEAGMTQEQAHKAVVGEDELEVIDL